MTMRLIRVFVIGLILMLSLVMGLLVTAQGTAVPPLPTLQVFSTAVLSGPVALVSSTATPIPSLSGVSVTPLLRDVSIRQGPGLEYDRIGALRYTTSLDMTGYNGYDLGRTCDGDFADTLDMWVEVRFAERYGWVARCTVRITGDFNIQRMIIRTEPRS
jgi:hypothetical protein